MFCHGRAAVRGEGRHFVQDVQTFGDDAEHGVLPVERVAVGTLVKAGLDFDAFLICSPLAMDTVPFAPCFNVARISSSKKRACSPYSLPYTESPPLPVPVGSPVWTSKYQKWKHART